MMLAGSARRLATSGASALIETVSGTVDLIRGVANLLLRPLPIQAAETRLGTCLAHIQMFLTEHNPGRIYTVNLAQDPAITQQNAHANLYRYFSGGKQGRFSGEATLLPAIRVAMAFPPTTPAVTDS